MLPRPWWLLAFPWPLPLPGLLPLPALVPAALVAPPCHRAHVLADNDAATGHDFRFLILLETGMLNARFRRLVDVHEVCALANAAVQSRS